MGAVRAAAMRRRSWPKVTDVAPTDAEVAELLEAAGRVSDHGGLVPWRVVAIRGDARSRLGDALVEAAGLEGEAAGLEGEAAAKLAAKPLRAPLLLALVAIVRPHPKVPEWEQEACAAGVGHVLTLLLDEAGWGVMWRTGPYTRHPSVARMLGLAENERLMGWLYVGGKPESGRPERRRGPVAQGRLSEPA